MRLILRRIAVAVVATFLLLALVCVITLHVRQRIFRNRADKIVSAIQSMEVGKSTCRELPSFEGLPAISIEKSGSCDSEAFYWSFRVRHLPSVLGFGTGIYQEDDNGYYNKEPIRRAFMALGVRPFGIGGSARFENGLLKDKHLSVMVAVPIDPTHPHERDRFIAAYTSVGSEEDRLYSSTRPDIVMRQRFLHPSYVIDRRIGISNADTGPRATVPYFDVEVLPRTPEEEIKDVLALNLDCLTRWNACSEAELMPGAAAQYERDVKMLNEGADAQTCGSATFQAVAREAENVAVVEVVAPSESSNDPDSEAAVVNLKLVSLVLRDQGWRRDLWTVGSSRQTWVFDRTPGTKNLSVPQMNEDDKFILLFKARRSGYGPSYWSYPCGLLPYNKENLGLTRAAIR